MESDDTLINIERTNVVKRLIGIIFLIWTFLFNYFACLAQFDVTTVGSRSVALGNAVTTLNDFWSAMSNQAALALQKEVTVGIAFSNQFFLKELSSKTIACALPVSKTGVFGFQYQHFGYNGYSEQKGALAYAMRFGKKFSVGLQFDYLFSFVNSEYYQNKSMFTFELGMQYRFSKAIVLGVHAFNPISVRRNQYQDERIPAIVQIGLQYAFFDELIGVLDVEKNILTEECLKFGLEYKLIKWILLRVGLTTSPVIYSFGAGVEYKKWNFDISSTTHSVLGISPQFSAIYHF